MTDVQSAVVSQAPIAIDPVEDGWDCGVDWANLRANDAQLALMRRLHATRCFDLDILIRQLNCEADDLFILTKTVTERHVEGFIDGAVAVYVHGGT
jgi:hypothetical protein